MRCCAVGVWARAQAACRKVNARTAIATERASVGTMKVEINSAGRGLGPALEQAMRHQLTFIVMLGLFGTFIGCETTGDPRQGGLLGYSPAKQKQRATALAQTAQDATAAAAAGERDVALLTQQQSDLTARLASARAQQAETQSQLNDLERRIREGASANEPTEAQIAQLRGKQEELRQELVSAEQLERAANQQDAVATKAARERVDNLMRANDELREQIRVITKALSNPS